MPWPVSVAINQRLDWMTAFRHGVASRKAQGDSPSHQANVHPKKSTCLCYLLSCDAKLGLRWLVSFDLFVLGRTPSTFWGCFFSIRCHIKTSSILIRNAKKTLVDVLVLPPPWPDVGGKKQEPVIKKINIEVTFWGCPWTELLTLKTDDLWSCFGSFNNTAFWTS